MKRCPACQKTYPHALAFCVSDAGALEDTGVRAWGDLLQRDEPVDLARATRLAARLCDALQAECAKGHVPPPLQPLDLELTGEGASEDVRVTFGVESSALTAKDGTLDGVAPYAAPEVLRKGPATPASAVYNAAVVLYESVTGRLPFTGSTAAALVVRQMLERPPSPKSLRPELTDALSAALLRALDRDPAARFETPAAFAEALRSAAVEVPEARETPFESLAAIPAMSYARAPSAPLAGAAPGAVMASAAPAPMAAPAGSGSPVPDLAQPAAVRPRRRWGPLVGAVGGLALFAVGASLLMFSRGASHHAPRLERATASRSVGAPMPAQPVIATPQTATAPSLGVPQPISPTVQLQPIAVAPPPALPRPRTHARHPTGRAQPARPTVAARSQRAPTADNDAMMGAEFPAPPMAPALNDPLQGTRSGAGSVRDVPRPRTTPRTRTAPPTQTPRAEGERGVVNTPRPTPEEPARAPAQGAPSAAPLANTRSPSAPSAPVPTPAPVPETSPTVEPQGPDRDDTTSRNLFLAALAVAAAGAGMLVLALALIVRRRAQDRALTHSQSLPAGAWMPLPQTSQPPAPPLWQPTPLPAPPPAPAPVAASYPPPPWQSAPAALDAKSSRDMLGRPVATPDDAYANTVEVSANAAPTPGAVSGVRCAKCGHDVPAEARFCPHDGAPVTQASWTDDVRSLPAHETAEPAMQPFVIGQYRCESRLGEGGMGVVYKARHTHLDRVCALKVLLPQAGMSEKAIERFRREARLASSITHPNSVTIYDYGEVDGPLFYLAMEFIQGRALEDVMGRRPMPLARVSAYVQQICDGLDVAHQAGIVHRDLKPQNVMVCERAGRADLVKIVDFGIARSLGVSEKTMSGAVVGTPIYMAPEQARGEADVGVRADVFSLGVMTFEMLTGTYPFAVEGNVIQQVVARAMQKTPARRLAEALPGGAYDPALEGVLARALAIDPKERTPGVLAFAEELSRAARQAA
jgi:serine/threonine protein kinase